MNAHLCISRMNYLQEIMCSFKVDLAVKIYPKGIAQNTQRPKSRFLSSSAPLLNKNTLQTIMYKLDFEVFTCTHVFR